MVPIMAISFDYGVELTYPIGESFSTGLLLSSGQFFGVIYTVVSSILIDNKGQTGSQLTYIILACACALATTVSFFLKQTLKRYAEEQRQKLIK